MKNFTSGSLKGSLEFMASNRSSPSKRSRTSVIKALYLKIAWYLTKNGCFGSVLSSSYSFNTYDITLEEIKLSLFITFKAYFFPVLLL